MRQSSVSSTPWTWGRNERRPAPRARPRDDRAHFIEFRRAAGQRTAAATPYGLASKLVSIRPAALRRTVPDRTRGSMQSLRVLSESRILNRVQGVQRVHGVQGFWVQGFRFKGFSVLGSRFSDVGRRTSDVGPRTSASYPRI